MDYQLLNEYKGKTVQITVNSKNISGILSQVNEKDCFVETDYGVVQLKNNDITDVNSIKLLEDLYVYICKNEICNCKGIRYLTSGTSKLNWPCKYFKKFSCPIKKVCNFNTLPLKIKNRFLQNMHSPIPPFQNKQN